jgi:hypothetical protein
LAIIITNLSYKLIHGCHRPGKPGKPGRVRELICKSGKPGKVREFISKSEKPGKNFNLINTIEHFLFCSIIEFYDKNLKIHEKINRTWYFYSSK